MKHSPYCWTQSRVLSSLSLKIKIDLVTSQSTWRRQESGDVLVSHQLWLPNDPEEAWGSISDFQLLGIFFCVCLLAAQLSVLAKNKTQNRHLWNSLGWNMTRRSGVPPSLPPLTLCSSGLLRLLQETSKHLVMMWKLNPIRPASFPSLKLVCVARENRVRLGLCWAGEINKVVWGPSCVARPGCGCHRLEKQWPVSGLTLQGTLINHGSFLQSMTNNGSSVLWALLPVIPPYLTLFPVALATGCIMEYSFPRRTHKCSRGRALWSPGLYCSPLETSRVSQRWPCSYRFPCITPSKRHCFILFTALATVDEFNSLIIFEYVLNPSAHPEVWIHKEQRA